MALVRQHDDPAATLETLEREVVEHLLRELDKGMEVCLIQPLPLMR
jgi:hypothetical protein